MSHFEKFSRWKKGYHFEANVFQRNLFSKWLFFEVTDFIVTHFWSKTFFSKWSKSVIDRFFYNQSKIDPWYKNWWLSYTRGRYFTFHSGARLHEVRQRIFGRSKLDHARSRSLFYSKGFKTLITNLKFNSHAVGIWSVQE